MMAEGSRQNRPTIYQVKIKGRLDESWAEWFEPMTVTHTEDGNTILKGRLADQATLQGVLIKLGNLNLELISVNQADKDI